MKLPFQSSRPQMEVILLLVRLLLSLMVLLIMLFINWTQMETRSGSNIMEEPGVMFVYQSSRPLMEVIYLQDIQVLLSMEVMIMPFTS